MNRIPDNEFSEQFTGDMASMDTAWHGWNQDKYNEARLRWEKAQQTIEYLKSGKLEILDWWSMLDNIPPEVIENYCELKLKWIISEPTDGR